MKTSHHLSSLERTWLTANAEAGVFRTNLPEMPPFRTWAALRYTHQWGFAEFGGTGSDQKRPDMSSTSCSDLLFLLELRQRVNDLQTELTKVMNDPSSSASEREP